MTNFFPRLSQNCGVQEGLKNAFDLHSATRHNFVNATNTLHHSGESKRSTYICISYFPIFLESLITKKINYKITLFRKKTSLSIIIYHNISLVFFIIYKASVKRGLGLPFNHFL